MKSVFIVLFIISIMSLIGLGLGLYSTYLIPKSKTIFFTLIAISLVTIFGFGLCFKIIYNIHQQNYAITTQLQQELDNKQKLIDSFNSEFENQLLFIHHSVGQNWIYEGGLGESLIKYGIGVHDATYGDEIGEKTDINHWVQKFQDDIDKIFKFKTHSNIYYGNDRENDIIMFKSCFPNSDVVDEGVAPGKSDESLRTLWNYKATFIELKKEFSKYPGKIFIYITAPPLVPAQTTPENAVRARKFNNWVKGEFIVDYRGKTGLNNFLVFDFFDILADDNSILKKEYRLSETDSHPNNRGAKQATELFIEFLITHGIIKNSMAIENANGNQ